MTAILRHQGSRWWGRQEWMEACDFHQRSPPAWGRNCKFPFISSCVALGTSVKWVNFNSDFILIIVFLSFPFTWKELLAIVPRSLFGGSHPGERHVRASDSTTKSMHGLGVRQDGAWNGSSVPHRSCERSRDQVVPLTSISSSSRLVSSKGPYWWWSRDMASILRAEWTTWCFWSPPAIRSTDELDVLCSIYYVNPCCVCANNRIIRFFMEYPVLGSLWDPIINNTITKTFVFCSILSFIAMSFQNIFLDPVSDCQKCGPKRGFLKTCLIKKKKKIVQCSLRVL